MQPTNPTAANSTNPELPLQVACPNCRGYNPPNAAVCMWCRLSLRPPLYPQQQTVSSQSNWTTAGYVGTSLVILGVAGVLLMFALISIGTARSVPAIEQVASTEYGILLIATLVSTLILPGSLMVLMQRGK